MKPQEVLRLSPWDDWVSQAGGERTAIVSQTEASDGGRSPRTQGAASGGLQPQRTAWPRARALHTGLVEARAAHGLVTLDVQRLLEHAGTHTTALWPR